MPTKSKSASASPRSHLKHLHVEAYKSLVDASVELATVNIFIGANGSGKTNLLEAVGLLGAAISGTVNAESLRFRGLRVGMPFLYKSSIKGQRSRRLITLEASAERALYRVGFSSPVRRQSTWTIATETLLQGKKPLLTRSPRGARLYSQSGTAESIKPPKESSAARLALTRRPRAQSAKALTDGLEQYAIYTPGTPLLRELVPDVRRPPVGLSGGGLAEAVHRLRHRAGLGAFHAEEVLELIDWARNVTTFEVPTSEELSGAAPTPERNPILVFVDRYMREDREMLTAYDASEGALYVLFLLVLASEPANRILAIDNFDTALHPRLARRLTQVVTERVIERGGPQLILTTHSPLVLDGLNLLDSRVRLFAVDRAESGVTQVSRIELTGDLLGHAREGLSLSRLWTMGRLGGIPPRL